MLEENLQENQRKNYISGINQAFKSKVLKIHLDTYIVDCSVSNQPLTTSFFLFSVAISISASTIFFFVLFFEPSLSYFPLYETHSTIQLPCLIRIHYNQHSISQQYSIQEVFTIDCKQRFKTRKELKRKNCNLKHVLFILSFQYISLFLEPLPRSKVFTIMDNPGIYRLLSQCILISLIVKKGIFFILIFHSFQC